MNDDLRAAAQAATPIWGQVLTQDDGDKQLDFQRLASPDRILGLLDELERKTAGLLSLDTIAQRGVDFLHRRGNACPAPEICDLFTDIQLAARGLARAALGAREPAPSSEKGEE